MKGKGVSGPFCGVQDPEILPNLGREGVEREGAKLVRRRTLQGEKSLSEEKEDERGLRPQTLNRGII